MSAMYLIQPMHYQRKNLKSVGSDLLEKEEKRDMCVCVWGGRGVGGGWEKNLSNYFTSAFCCQYITAATQPETFQDSHPVC